MREVTSLLEQQPHIVNSPRYGGLAPIHYACHKQNIRILRVLLDHGAKVRLIGLEENCIFGKKELHDTLSKDYQLAIFPFL